MFKFRPIFAVTFGILAFNNSLGFADWEGNIHMKFDMSGASKLLPTEGKIHFKKNQLRMDSNAHGIEMSILVDQKSKRAWTLIPMMKAKMKMDFDKAQRNLPECTSSSGGAEECLIKTGFKKVGSESMNGHACTVFEKNTSDQNIKIWQVTDMKDFGFVRVVTSGKQGGTVTNITDLKTIEQPDSLFQIPADYRETKNPFGG